MAPLNISDFLLLNLRPYVLSLSRELRCRQVRFVIFLSDDFILPTAFEYSVVAESRESDLVVDIQPACVNHSTFMGLMIANNFAVTVWAVLNPILASSSQH
jgi:hypothetical protein